MNEVGFERTEYAVSEDVGFLDVRVRLSDIDFTQTNDDTLGVTIMVSVSTPDGTATGKRVGLIACMVTKITCMVIQSNQFTLLPLYSVVILYCLSITKNIQ